MIDKQNLEAFKQASIDGKTELAKQLMQPWTASEFALSPVSSDLHPLLWTLQNRQWELVLGLLDKAIPFEKIEIYNYYSPLAWACLCGQSDVIKALLTRGVDPKAKDANHKTALHWASEYGYLEAVESLLQAGADLNVRHHQVPSPIFMAIWRGKLNIVECLITAGAELTDRDYWKHTVLHAAVYSGMPEMMKLILRHFLKLDTQNQSGQSPLHLASQIGYIEIAKLLIEAGANIRLKDQQGKTALELAASQGQVSVFDCLLEHHASFYRKEQKLAMKAAIAGNHPQMVKRLLQWFDLSATLNAEHPLMIAIQCQQYAIVMDLLASGADVNAVINGESLLNYAQKQANPQLVKLLIQAGAQTRRESAIRWMDNLVYLRKYGKVILTVGTGQLSGDLLLALQKNLESLGYVLSAELAERVLTLSIDELSEFYELLIPCLQVMVGGDKVYQPMYPNFPEQVKQMTHVELYLNALHHYWGDLIGERILPNFKKTPRTPLEDTIELRVLHLGSESGLMQLFVKFLQARSSLRPEDKEDLVWFISTRQDQILEWLPDEIPQRENAAILAAALLKHTDLQAKASQYIKMAVDVLRFATAYSDGDVSLAESTHFVSFGKKLRRWMLAQLEQSPNLDEDLWRHPEKFKRLAERLHPGDYKKQYPKCWQAFQRLRQGKKPETFASQVEVNLARRSIDRILPLLQSRPGEFARRLDHVLRVSENSDGVIEAFAACIERIPSPLLLQLMTHFALRSEPQNLRVFFPKGDLAKLHAIDANLPELDIKICQQIVDLCRQTLLARFAQKPALGNCFLDPDLKNYTVPFAMRSASKALNTVSRGSRISLPNASTIRFFIWWKDGRERTDIDLSAFALSDQFENQITISYYNLKDLGGYHSGDITSAPQGASEFIDIELEPFLSRNTRYVMMVVNSFTTQAYCDLPECFAGVMARQRPNSGEIYDPRTVLHKFDLSANSTIAIPMILDLYENQIIWTDLSLNRNASESNNVHNNRSSLSLLCQAMTQLRKPNLHQLFELHIQARGQHVDDISQAQTVFSVSKGLTPFDIPTILAEYI